MKIRRILLTLPALLLALVLIGGFFPPGSFAEEGDGTLPLRFVCDETEAQVTVYDTTGQHGHHAENKSPEPALLGEAHRHGLL